MKIYHSDEKELTDGQAQRIMQSYKQAVEGKGGTISVSRSFHHGPAILVVQLPEGIDPSTVITAFPFVEFVGTEQQNG